MDAGSTLRRDVLGRLGKCIPSVRAMILGIADQIDHHAAG